MLVLRVRTVSAQKLSAKQGFDYVHSAGDDHTRAYSEIRPTKGHHLRRLPPPAAAFFTTVGITRIERVLTENLPVAPSSARA